MFDALESPLEFDLGYTLPDEYGPDNVFKSDYVEDRFYLPSTAHPSFKVIGKNLCAWFDYNTVDSLYS